MARSKGYRKLKIQKRVKGKLKRYKNLATFNRECTTRGNFTGVAMLCDLTNVRKLKDGSGMATVKVISPHADSDRIKRRGGSKSREGTWLLHFASYDVMKQKIKKRVSPSRAGMLDGRKRR